MAVALYMDVHVPIAVTAGLRLRDVDVLTAWEDGTTTLSDSDLLDRATDLNRVLFTFDDDLLVEAASRQSAGTPFAGVIYIHLLNVSIGRSVDDLELIAKASTLEECSNRVHFLPL